MHHGFIPRCEFEGALLDACRTNGLLAREGQRAILGTIDSGLRWAENDQLPDLGEPKVRKSAKRQRKSNGADAEADSGGDQREVKLRAAIDRLASLSLAKLALIDKKAEADALGITVPELKALVKEAREAADKASKAAARSQRRGSRAKTDIGVSMMRDFYAVLPMHHYLFVPTRDLWPAETINSLFGDADDELIRPAGAGQDARGSSADLGTGLAAYRRKRLVCDAGWIDRQELPHAQSLSPASHRRPATRTTWTHGSIISARFTRTIRAPARLPGASRAAPAREDQSRPGLGRAARHRQRHHSGAGQIRRWPVEFRGSLAEATDGAVQRLFEVRHLARERGARSWRRRPLCVL